MLQGIIDRLAETQKCYGMEMNVEKTKVIRTSRKPSPVQVMIDQKPLQNIAYFNYLDSIITNDARYTHKIIFRTATAKAAFTRRKTLLTNKLDFNLRKKVMKCYISNTALYDAETWMLQKIHHIYLENSEIWSWR